ncbi:8-oxoguanine glycosylase OGG1 [Aspergillus clavatus NRRL 1]|uniref:DNA-(apurinic or apyrimidinic site) lyase n=1 Tax=Aspergillus clavatus (strain ATCC 1007 / CBS 513.65 / DSM 816 / NCTC 3887 / NRRL 1 / QM 1276 / 107) TaxID=344612 RepID=A1CDL6_ASPCL|nr:8-oxoguanine DNA glycosylase [Aspergillus clavatus NRRL 1]EAW11943.1 8-oxoguanine DNA glycosylase [Aspergillus clavatus NRRL 1]
MTVGVFSEWRKFSISLSELCINTTLRCGQSFRWQRVPDTDEWRCVLHGRLLSLRQDPEYLYYRTHRSPSLLSKSPSTSSPSHVDSSSIPGSTNQHTVQERSSGTDQDDESLKILKHYLNLSSNLTDLYTQWSSQDPNFKKKAPQFTGIRILRQDAWEALVSFICSSNNNISRISQMVEKLCVNYGPLVATVGERAYHDFPTPEALTGDDVESRLRSLGFGYRAKYIYQTALIVAKERGQGWLDSLRNPECPAFGIEPVPGGEMQPEGRQGYRYAHEQLLELQGVGPKVADCVCLMGLGWGEAVPVDTHVWQIAQRDYKFGRGAHKSLTKATYDAVGNHFRKLWGQEAGWAHSVLFTADLRSFSDRLAVSTKKVDVKVAVKEEDDDKNSVAVMAEVATSTATAVKRPASEVGVKSEKIEETKESLKAIIEASQTTTTRRMSKRLRNR